MKPPEHHNVRLLSYIYYLIFHLQVKQREYLYRCHPFTFIYTYRALAKMSLFHS